MGKKIGVCALVAMLTFPIFVMQEAYAAVNSASNYVKDEEKPMLSKRQIINKKKLAIALSDEYGVSIDKAISLLNNGYRYRDLQTAFLYAELADVPVAKVLDLHKGATWGRVRVLLGMDADSFAEKMQERQLNRLVIDGILKKDIVRKCMQQGYPLEDIKMAAKISIDANIPLMKVLPMRTVVKDWQQVRTELNLDHPNVEIKQKVRNQRSGAGFAGLRLQYEDKERRLKILSRDYNFTQEELSELYDELGFVELENVCLYAYLGNVKLAKMMEMRNSYSWERIKHVLGLTPQIYFDRCVEYQARRLKERMQIPVEFTKRLMNEGYAMHYINSAWLLGQQCGISADEIIVMKTPYNTWNDVAIALGLTIDDCQKVKDKISLEFGRHD